MVGGFWWRMGWRVRTRWTQGRLWLKLQKYRIVGAWELLRGRVPEGFVHIIGVHGGDPLELCHRCMVSFPPLHANCRCSLTQLGERLKPEDLEGMV